MRYVILFLNILTHLYTFCYASDKKNVAFSIQVGSFKELKNAGTLADSLNKKGLDAFFFKENGAYKVRFGNYKNANKAREEGKRLQSLKLIHDFFIINPNNYAINKKGKTTKNIRENIVKNAHDYIGTPYKWGGTSTSGFDCSGLVRAVYRLNGLDLPRVSQDQYNGGKFILKKDLQIGDLVFFTTDNSKRINHVGIYIGKNQFIHAPGKGKFVQKSNLDSNYWKKVYKGAKSYL